MVLLFNFTLWSTDGFSQLPESLPPTEDCSNPTVIYPGDTYQSDQIDMTSLDNYFISFQATDNSFYFEILSEGEFPSQLKLYSEDCYGELILESDVYADSIGLQSIELYPQDLIIGNNYMIEIEQNEHNSATLLTMSFQNPMPEMPPCCAPPKPPCADIMYNGSFEIDDISGTGIDLNQRIHLSHGYLLLDSRNNRGDYFHPKGDADFSPPNTITGNSISPVSTPAGADAYAGLFSVWTSLNNNNVNGGGAGEFREWICGQVNMPNGTMEAGKRYHVSMQVRLSNIPRYGFGSVPPGIRFSSQPTTANSQIDIVNMTADIQPQNIIIDATQWHTVEGFYTATGDEHYVTIANFQPDNQSFVGGGYNVSYFFVDAITIIPADLCCTELTIPNGWDTDDLLNSAELAPFINGNTLEGVDVNVEGTFTVNSDLMLRNVQFNMAPNSKINVINNSTFTLDSSKLKTCSDTMWQGVEVINSTAEVIMINNSEIWDAEKGILSTNGGNFTINDSYFNSNDYGIYVDEYIIAKHEGSVEGTTFDATHSLLHPISTSMASAGIYLNGVANINGTNDILIGNANGNSNHFNTPKYHANMAITDGLKYGIHAEQSSFKVVNSIFENFTQITTPKISPDKSAIKVVGLPYGTFYSGYVPIAEIGDMSLNSSNQNKFLQSSSAVNIDGIQDITIENNKIDFTNNNLAVYTIEYAIEIENNFWSATKCIVNDNTIQGVVNGVRLENIQELDRVSVSNNIIELMNLPENTGIRLNQVHPTNIISYQINGNTISKGIRGLEINSSVVPQVSFNNISLNTTITSSIPNYGILINLSILPSQYFPAVSYNTILGDAITYNTDVNGISVANVGGVNIPILCNDIQQTGTALYMNNVNNQGSSGVAY